MNRDQLSLISFVLDVAPSAPVGLRISVYRGLADLCGDAEESKKLESLAEELERAEMRCREFSFAFSQKNLRDL